MATDVSLSKVTYFTLRRHHLLQRAPRDHAVDVIEDILGLNAQGALNYNLSLWNRVEGLDRGFINSAILDRRLLRSWFMRNTVHIMPLGLACLARDALRDSLVSEWDRWTVKTGSKASPGFWEKHYSNVLDALSHGPLTMGEILEKVEMGEDEKRLLNRVVREMSLKGLVCNAASRGHWYHDAEHTYADASRWAPCVERRGPDEAREALLLRYLHGYGPASAQDFAYWTGMKASDAKQVLQRGRPALTDVKVEGHKGKLYALKDDVPDLESTESEPSLRLLPKFDVLIMGHRDKTRFMSEATRRRVFLPTAEVSATLLRDGRVGGVWGMKKAGDGWRLHLSLFERLDGEAEEMLHAELEEMRKFTGFRVSFECAIG